MAIEARAELRLRVVEVEHHQPLEPDPPVEVGQEGVDGGRLADVDPGGPGVGRVEAEPEPLGRRRPGPAAASRMPASSVDIGAQPEPAPRRVLEDDHRRVRTVVDLGERQARARRRAARVPAATPAPRCEPTWTLTNRPEEPGRRPQVAGEDLHRAPEEVLLGPGEVDQVRGVDGDRPDVELGQASPEAAARPAARRRRRQAVGLSAKIWSASAPISCARSTALTMPAPRGRWAPRRRPSGSIRGIVRRATVEPAPAVPAAARREPQRRPDEARAGVLDGCRACV